MIWYVANERKNLNFKSHYKIGYTINHRWYMVRPGFFLNKTPNKKKRNEKKRKKRSGPSWEQKLIAVSARLQIVWYIHNIVFILNHLRIHSAQFIRLSYTYTYWRDDCIQPNVINPYIIINFVIGMHIAQCDRFVFIGMEHLFETARYFKYALEPWSLGLSKRRLRSFLFGIRSIRVSGFGIRIWERERERILNEHEHEHAEIWPNGF